MAASNSFRLYYRLTKPGIVYGNAISAAAGFLFAAHRHVDFPLLLEMLVGISLVIASACVTNNYLDKDIDAKMARTKKRALVQGTVIDKAALIYAVILDFAGFFILARYTNALTVIAGLIGLYAYVLVYGWGKRHTVWGTLIGSIPGAMPLLAGYLAVTDKLTTTALLLFVLMAIWQLPHFYAISIYRLKDYKAANLPVWSVKKGILSTKRQIVFLIALFMILNACLGFFHYAGRAYFFVMVVLSALWLDKGLRTWDNPKAESWARGMFGFSLIVLMGWSFMLAVNAWLP